MTFKFGPLLCWSSKFYFYHFGHASSQVLSQLVIPSVRTRFEFLAQHIGWTQAQQAQYNEFVDSRLENWAKMSWTTNKVGSNDKNRKIY